MENPLRRMAESEGREGGGAGGGGGRVGWECAFFSHVRSRHVRYLGAKARSLRLSQRCSAAPPKRLELKFNSSFRLPLLGRRLRRICHCLILRCSPESEVPRRHFP